MNAQSPSLLLVDDEAGLRRSLNFGMAQQGYHVDALEEGLPALDMVDKAIKRGSPYNCVVADINLPDINGLKLLEVLKSKYPNQPVIVISAYGNEATRDQVATMRGDAYLDKPFLVEELTALLKGLPARKVVVAERPAADLGVHTVSAYAAIKLREDGDYAETFRRLYVMDNVIYCDAVQGDMDVVMLLNAASYTEIEEIVRTRINTMPEVESVVCQNVVKPEIDPAVAQFIAEYSRQRTVSPSEYKLQHSRSALTAYLFIEVQDHCLASVFPKLCFLERVVSCDATHGSSQITAVVQAQTVDQLNRTLVHDIKQIDGIARVRTARVINMLEM